MKSEFPLEGGASTPRDRAPYALLLVQIAIGRFVSVSPGSVRVRQRLREDFGLDPFDVALVAAGIEDEVDVDIPSDEVDGAATVGALADCVARALLADPRNFVSEDDDDELTPRDSELERSSAPPG